MGAIADARVLLALARGAGGAGSPGERLARFYAPQAADYDRFRDRLLHGRRELIRALPVPAGGNVVELGAGTGRNLEFFGDRLGAFGRVELVDLCEPLLAVARQRWRTRPHVQCIEADATRWQPSQPVDCVYLSYVLTMIPDWRAAIDNALAMLKPGGLLGVVDFHLPAQQGRFARAFWTRWFRHDGVRLSAAHLPRLRRRCATVRDEEHAGAVPYLPGLRAPWYLFIGRRPA